MKSYIEVYFSKKDPNACWDHREYALTYLPEQAGASFEEKVRVFEAFANDVSEKYVVNFVKAAANYGWGCAHTYEDLKKREFPEGMYYSCNAHFKEWQERFRDEAARHIEKFVVQEKAFHSYSSFDWGCVAQFFGADFERICNLVETCALAKVEVDADLFRAEFRNFCSLLDNVPRDSAMRSNEFLFDSRFRLFHFWLKVGDTGAGANAVSWIRSRLRW